ncbi:MAG: thermonuclease family protein [Flavobacterium sp.]|nr:thermonuclease family protein [Flavobacterium sp.]
MQLNAKETTITKSLLKIVKFVDGDGIILEDFVSKKEFEVRLYGIDAPEINYCNKIKKDEIELQVPAALLIKLGYLSFNFLKDQVNLGDVCTLVQEQNNLVDKYGRHLGYLILNDGRVLNEIMIKEGYAKPYNDVFCEMLPLYQEWNLQAKKQFKRIIFDSKQILNILSIFVLYLLMFSPF